MNKPGTNDRALRVQSSGRGGSAIPDITLGDAERLAKQCEYAWEAIEMPGNKINWADAGAFFLEGYLYAQRINENQEG